MCLVHRHNYVGKILKYGGKIDANTSVKKLSSESIASKNSFISLPTSASLKSVLSSD